MAASLFQHGAIRTTEVKAKELRRFVEKLITTARKGTLHARRLLIAELGDRELFDKEGDPTGQTLIQKIFDEIAPRYADRPGGYTRIVRLAERRIGDSGRQVLLQLVEEAGETESESAGSSRRKRRAAKRHAAAGKSASASATATAAEAERESDAQESAELETEESADAEAEPEARSESDETPDTDEEK